MSKHVYQFFCDKTVATLGKNTSLFQQDNAGTVQVILLNWKIQNVRRFVADVWFRDQERTVITSPHDECLDFLLEMAKMFQAMKGKQGNGKHQLTGDTSSTFLHNLLTPSGLYAKVCHGW